MTADPHRLVARRLAADVLKQLRFVRQTDDTRQWLLVLLEAAAAEVGAMEVRDGSK